MLDIEGVRRFIENGIMRLFQLAVLLASACVYIWGQDDLVLGLLCVSFVPSAVPARHRVSVTGANCDK